MGNFSFKIFTLLKTIPEKIVTSTGAVPSKVIDGAEHVSVSESGVEIDPEFWIGRLKRKGEK